MRRSREARSDTLHPLEPAGDTRWIPSTSERDEHAPKPLSRFRSGARTLLRWPLAGPFTMLAAWSVVLFVGAIFGILAAHLALTPYAVLSLASVSQSAESASGQEVWGCASVVRPSQTSTPG